jgi:hypothetical protein
MPDDNALKQAQEIGEQTLAELEQPVLSHESEQISREIGVLVDQFNKSVIAKDLARSQKLADDIRVAIRKQRDIIDRDLPAAELYLAEAQKEYKPGSPELEEAEQTLQAWQDFATQFLSFEEENTKRMDSVLVKKEIETRAPQEVFDELMKRIADIEKNTSTEIADIVTEGEVARLKANFEQPTETPQT